MHPRTNSTKVECGIRTILAELNYAHRRAPALYGLGSDSPRKRPEHFCLGLVQASHCAAGTLPANSGRGLSQPRSSSTVDDPNDLAWAGSRSAAGGSLVALRRIIQR